MKSCILIEHGEKTCASEPGKFCRFAGSKSFGTDPWCTLFNTRLRDKDGWLQRAPECLETAKEVKND